MVPPTTVISVYTEITEMGEVDSGRRRGCVFTEVEYVSDIVLQIGVLVKASVTW
jgi:hypothetical protein